MEGLGQDAAQIPLWLKLGYSAGLAIILATYWRKYGPQNFLWFSDIALIVTAVALWREDAFLASMMAVGVLLPELLWNVDFFARLLLRARLVGLSGYMFERGRPLFLRLLSLFHVVLPALLLWLVATLGYDERAWIAQVLLAWVVLPLTHAVTDPDRNINWVFGPGENPQHKLPARVYLALVMLAFPLLVFLPTHLALRILFGSG